MKIEKSIKVPSSPIPLILLCLLTYLAQYMHWPNVLRLTDICFVIATWYWGFMTCLFGLFALVMGLIFMYWHHAKVSFEKNVPKRDTVEHAAFCNERIHAAPVVHLKRVLMWCSAIVFVWGLKGHCAFVKWLIVFMVLEAIVTAAAWEMSRLTLEKVKAGKVGVSS